MRRLPPEVTCEPCEGYGVFLISFAGLAGRKVLCPVCKGVGMVEVKRKKRISKTTAL